MAALPAGAATTLKDTRLVSPKINRLHFLMRQVSRWAGLAIYQSRRNLYEGGGSQPGG